MYSYKDRYTVIRKIRIGLSSDVYRVATLSLSYIIVAGFFLGKVQYGLDNL